MLWRRLVQVPTVALALVGAVAMAGSPALADVAHASGSCTYVVQSGDTLAQIAARYGTNWQELAQINGLANPNTIRVGQHIVTCGAARASAGTTGTTAYYQSSAMVSSSSSSAADTYWAGEPCHSNVYATGPIYMWKVPPGCYAGVYWVNPNNYVARAGFGWCNWWPEVLHPDEPNILNGPRHSTPIPGAAVVFAPGEQGASSGGHYGEVVAVLGNGWILISEMNNTWRGAGFQRVNYRYVQEDGGVTYIY
jgi:hypothetical protein